MEQRGSRFSKAAGLGPFFPVPSGGTVRGTLRVPPSKSVSHRFFNLCLLARQSATIEHPLVAEDTHLFLRALERCGFDVEEAAQRVRLTAPEETAGARSGEIHCGNAGTMYRFLVATLTTVPGTWILDGTPRLRERPVGPLVAALRGLGCRIECLDREGFAPLRIHGHTLAGGGTRLDAGESSQYLSAVLMAATRARATVQIDVESLTSTPYVQITLEAMARFGAHAKENAQGYEVKPTPLAGGSFEVEGDFSAAAYPASAAALTKGEVILEGLRPQAPQGDRRFLSVLESMGAHVDWDDHRVRIRGGSLRAVAEDFADMPDQVPTLAALAPYCHGTTRVSNVEHLRIKESDRLRAMATELARLGADVEEKRDGLVISGGWSHSPTPTNEVQVETYDDHRIAMSLALVGLRRPGVTVANPGVVEKSYPSFWRDLEALLEG